MLSKTSSSLLFYYLQKRTLIIVVETVCEWLDLFSADYFRYAVTKAFCIAFLMTFFSVFDVPVFWPILLFYWMVLFVLTMKRQIMHMIKYKYLPFSIGKQVTYISSFPKRNFVRFAYFWKLFYETSHFGCIFNRGTPEINLLQAAAVWGQIELNLLDRWSWSPYTWNFDLSLTLNEFVFVNKQLEISYWHMLVYLLHHHPFLYILRVNGFNSTLCLTDYRMVFKIFCVNVW